MKIEEQAIEVAKGEILKKLATDEPYLFGEKGIYHRVKQLQNGEIMFSIRIVQGFVTDLVETKIERFVFKKK